MSKEKEKITDELFLENLKKEFLESVSQCLVDLRSLIKEKKFDEIEKLAHDIKGTAGVFGLHEGSTISEKLQHSAKNKDYKSSKALINELIEYMKNSGVDI